MHHRAASPNGEPHKLYRVAFQEHGDKRREGGERRQEGRLAIQLARQRAPVWFAYELSERLVKGVADVDLVITDRASSTRSRYAYDAESAAFRFGRDGRPTETLQAMPNGHFSFRGFHSPSHGEMGRAIARSDGARAISPEAFAAGLEVLELQTAPNARMLFELIIRPLINIIKVMLVQQVATTLSSVAAALLAAVDTMSWGEIIHLYNRLCWGEVA